MAYIVKAVFGSESIVKTDTIYQYNSGQVLQIEGLAFTNSTEFHLAIHGKDTAYVMTGTIENNTAKITIPEVLMINDFCTCNYRIDVFVYVIDNSSGYTKYKIIIPVKSRPRPEGYYVDLPTVPELKSLKQELNTAVDNFNDAYTEIDQLKSETASLKEDIGDVLDIKVTSYPNKVNPDEFQSNKTINTSGQIVDSDNQYITNKFSVSKGDTVYLTILKGDLFLDVASVTMMYLCCFKKDGTLSGDGRNQFSQSKKIEDDETAYCIVAMSNQTVGSAISITLNNYPTSRDTFEEYKPDKIESERIVKIEEALSIQTTNKIVDFWGDSRIEMGKNDNTSIAYKTGELLGDNFITTNNGISGQCSGAVAFRFGASEVFGTVENNILPASGSVDITPIVTTGARNGNNLMVAGRGSRCLFANIIGYLGGDSGRGKITFTREIDGDAVNISANTKFIPDNLANYNHRIVFWCGKNDNAFAGTYYISGVLDNYRAMISKLKHNKFLILGETYSNNDNFNPGSTYRTKTDNLNSQLASLYPDNYIDIQSRLVADGLTLAGLSASEKDTECLAKGWIADSLMNGPVHLNAKGREVVAKIIYEWMQQHGLID